MNDIINYIIKEIVISTKNQDWARLKSITEYKRKAKNIKWDTSN